MFERRARMVVALGLVLVGAGVLEAGRLAGEPLLAFAESAGAGIAATLLLALLDRAPF